MKKKSISNVSVVLMCLAIILIALITINATFGRSGFGNGEMSQFERDYLYEMKQQTRYLNEISSHLEKISRK